MAGNSNADGQTLSRRLECDKTFSRKEMATNVAFLIINKLPRHRTCAWKSLTKSKSDCGVAGCTGTERRSVPDDDTTNRRYTVKRVLIAIFALLVIAVCVEMASQSAPVPHTADGTDAPQNPAATATPTPTASPSPSPTGSPTPVPEPEPAPSGSPTPLPPQPAPTGTPTPVPEPEPAPSPTPIMFNPKSGR